jgi:hypothetical protein
MNHVTPVAVTAALSLVCQIVGPPIPDLSLRLGPHSILTVVTIQTEGKLRQVIGPGAGEIVRDAISRFRKISRVDTRLVGVIAEQLPEEWLPALKEVSFQRLPVNWEGWKADCARVMWLEAVSDGDDVRVTVSEGNSCGHISVILGYSRDGRHSQGGAGGGAGGHSGPCGCR